MYLQDLPQLVREYNSHEGFAREVSTIPRANERGQDNTRDD